jgi:ABC-type hemin transport system substrate-binding protein
MDDEGKLIIEEVLIWLKVGRLSVDVVAWNAFLMSDRFEEKIIKPLEKLCDWTQMRKERDEKVAALAKNIRTEIAKEKTLKSKWEKIMLILTVGGGIAAVMGAAGAIHQGKKKNKNTKE